MTAHGVGSWYSPIVISDSDDSDEAYVELELERRISSPREGMVVDYDDFREEYAWQEDMPDLYDQEQRWDNRAFRDAPEYPHFQETVHQPMPSQKRKRSESPIPSMGRQAPSAFPSLPPKPRHVSPNAPPGESKTARKKRKKRERQAASAGMQQPLSGSSSSFEPLPPPPAPSHIPPLYHPPAQNLLPFVQFPQPHTLPPKPSFHPFPMEVMEASLLLAHQMMTPVPIQPSFEPTNRPPTPPHYYPTTEEIEDGSLGSLLPEPPRPKPVVKKSIGMAPDANPASHHGTYKSPNPKFVPPNPARTLVMELLPKKFRNLAFIRSWASPFARPGGVPRVDLDVKNGKGLVEFPTAEMARMAWESERMFGDGKEHIRVWWYRVPGIGADAGVGVLEEGEIEDGELAKGGGKKDKKKKAKTEHRAPVSPILLIPPTQPPLAPAPAKPSSPVARKASSSSGLASLPPKPMFRPSDSHSGPPARQRRQSVHQPEIANCSSPIDSTPSAMYTPASAKKTQESDEPILPFIGQTESFISSRGPDEQVELVAQDVQLTTSNIQGATGTGQPLLVNPSARSPRESSQPTSSAASDTLESPIFSLTSTSSPEPHEDMAPTRSPKSTKQELMTRMARAKEELTRRSHSKDSTRDNTPATKIEPFVLRSEAEQHIKAAAVVQTVPQPSKVVPSGAASHEDLLRREVLKSLKNKAAPKPEGNATVESRKLDLDDLATSFIMDSIEGAAITKFAPPPTPSIYTISSRIFVGERETICYQEKSRALEPVFSEKVYNSEKSVILSRTLNRQRELMAQLDRVPKAEKGELLRQLKEVERLHRKELDNLDDRRALGERLQHAWPETDLKQCIIEISDDEDEGEDEDAMQNE